MQITAGSVTGRFGRRPHYWAKRMLDEGMVHILATDAHHIDKRPPLLAEAEQAVIPLLGAAEARHLVFTRPQAIVSNLAPHEMPALPLRAPVKKARGLWNRLLSR